MNNKQTAAWDVYGHDWAVRYLQKAMLNNRIRQAYLIMGMPSIGKTRFAHAFAMALNCTHPDIEARPCGECRSCRLVMSGNHPDMVYSELDATTGALRIEALRAVTQRIALKPYESRYRIAIISDFDRARGQAQDAILKTLEEPPPHAIMLLLASGNENILSTITSRCQTIYLRPVPVDQLQTILVHHYQADDAHAALLARLSSGRIGWALDVLHQPDLLDQRTAALDLLDDIIKMNRAERFDIAADLSKDKSALPTLLELWQTYWRDILLAAQKSPIKLCNSDRTPQIERLMYDLNADDARRALQAVQDLMQQLSVNVNLRLALEVFMLALPGLRR